MLCCLVEWGCNEVYVEVGFMLGGVLFVVGLVDELLIYMVLVLLGDVVWLLLCFLMLVEMGVCWWL